MTYTDSGLPSPTAYFDLHDDPDLHVRIGAEFSEMPGLRLTLSQASRLFNVERARCERALSVLVSVGALSSDGATFRRAGAGRQGL